MKRLAWLDPVANWANDRAENQQAGARLCMWLRNLINRLQGRKS